MSIFMISMISMISTLLLLGIGSAVEQRNKHTLDNQDELLEAQRRFNLIVE